MPTSRPQARPARIPLADTLCGYHTVVSVSSALQAAVATDGPHKPQSREVVCVHKYRDACFRFNKLAEMQIIEAENLGAFYKHVKRRIKHCSVIPTIIDSTVQV